MAIVYTSWRQYYHGGQVGVTEFADANGGGNGYGDANSNSDANGRGDANNHGDGLGNGDRRDKGDGNGVGNNSRNTMMEGRLVSQS